MTGPSRVAVLDVGTNSVKCLVAEPLPGEEADLRVLSDRVRVTRLGEGLDRTGRLTPEGIGRTLRVLTEMLSEARAAGASVVATGRSDFPKQVNNCLGFPGIFRGALDVRAARVDEAMKLAAAEALAALIPQEDLREDRILPDALDPRVVPALAAAVGEAARRSGLARR